MRFSGDGERRRELKMRPKLGLIDDLRRLPPQKQLLALAASIAMAAGVLFMVRATTTPPLTLLYSDLDSSSAGEIVEYLDSSGVKYDIRGDAIFVPQNRRDAIRMSLAADGLPRQGQAGFELLDQVNSFSSTSDMFDATYWRAKEGELARTIISTPGVKSARVHIANPKRSAFLKGKSAASAVATIEMARGRLNVEQAQAARFIIALAVPDLDPENVAIIDPSVGVILAPGGRDMNETSSANLRERELALENSLVDMLEARVGAGNVRVKVSLEVTQEQETIFERILDPKQRIMTERDSTEIQETGAEAAGAVTVASNIPEGDVSATPASRSKRNEAVESTKFDVSERRREKIVNPGAVKRLQVAVLVNQPVAEEGVEGAPPTRSEDELASIRSLTAAAVGFDAERGDVISVESLSFDTPVSKGETVTKNVVMDFLKLNLMTLIQLLVPAIVAIVLGLFVLKPLLTPQKTGELLAAAPASGAQQLPAPQEASKPAPTPTPVDDLQRIAAQQQSASAKVITAWLDPQDAAA